MIVSWYHSIVLSKYFKHDLDAMFSLCLCWCEQQAQWIHIAGYHQVYFSKPTILSQIQLKLGKLCFMVGVFNRDTL